MAGIPGRSGGARNGSGRKSLPRLERLEPIREQLDDRLQQQIDQRLTALEQLATGGLQTVTEHWQLAGTIMIDATRELTAPEGAAAGRTARHKVRALPDKPADELVLVSRTVHTLAPNLNANIYLVNRLVGTPTPVETPEDQTDAGSLPAELDDIITRIYGETSDPLTFP